MNIEETNLGKPGPGRPKGALNKRNKELEEKVEWVLENMEPYLLEDLAAMKPTDRIRLWYDLIEYIRPKKQRVDVDLTQDDDKITKFTFEVITGKREPVQEPIMLENGESY